MKYTIVLLCIICAFIWLGLRTIQRSGTENARSVPIREQNSVEVSTTVDASRLQTAVVDGTATAAALVIARALSATPPPLTLSEDAQATDAVKVAATQRAEEQRVAAAHESATAQQHAAEQTEIAATLTAEPTHTPTPTSTPTSTPTPTPMPTPMPTWTPAPLATSTPVPAPQIQNFAACPKPCQGDGSNAQRTFPAGTKIVYLTWVFQDFPIDAAYTRRWTLVGKGEWVRYECAWPGPASGIENLTLSIPGGIHAGTWEVTITIDNTEVLREQITVEGNWDLWDPPESFTTCYGKR